MSESDAMVRFLSGLRDERAKVRNALGRKVSANPYLSGHHGSKKPDGAKRLRIPLLSKANDFRQARTCPRIS